MTKSYVNLLQGIRTGESFAFTVLFIDDTWIFLWFISVKLHTLSWMNQTMRTGSPNHNLESHGCQNSMKERAAVWTQHHLHILHVCFPRTFLSQQKMNIDDNPRRRSFPWPRWSRAWTLALCHDHRCRGGAKPWKEWSTHGVSTDVEKPPVSLGKWSVMESVPCVFLTGVRSPEVSFSLQDFETAKSLQDLLLRSL